MKTCTFIFTACLALMAGTATAQTGKFEAGAQGGLSLIFLRGNDVLKSYNGTGLSFSGGLFAQYNFTERLALRIDPGFERKGNIFRGTAYDQNLNPLGKVTSRLSYDYLTLPVLVRATFGKKYKLFVNAGPYAAYLLNVTQSYKGEGFPDSKSDYPYPHKDFDFGITAGVGVTAPLKEKLVLSLELRNSLGLADISEGEIINNGTIQTNATNLLVGIAYRM